MGKKNKKSFYKKALRPFIKDNRVLLAALGGAAAGITLANVLGTQKAQEVLHTVEDSISHFKDRVVSGISAKTPGKFPEPREVNKAKGAGNFPEPRDENKKQQPVGAHN